MMSAPQQFKSNQSNVKHKFLPLKLYTILKESIPQVL